MLIAFLFEKNQLVVFGDCECEMRKKSLLLPASSCTLEATEFRRKEWKQIRIIRNSSEFWYPSAENLIKETWKLFLGKNHFDIWRNSYHLAFLTFRANQKTHETKRSTLIVKKSPNVEACRFRPWHNKSNPFYGGKDFRKRHKSKIFAT